MNTIQKQQIQQLRLAGQSYASIAAEVGANENTVKSYCQRNGLGGRTTPPVQSALPVNPEACLQCGNALVQREKVKRRKFCNSLCRALWWADNPAASQRKAAYQQPCVGCGQPFTAYGNRQRKYCTHPCYVATRFGTGGEPDES